MSDEELCDAVVDVIWMRKRYPNQHCQSRPGHVHSPLPVSAKHTAQIPGRIVFWANDERTYNAKYGRFEVRG